MVYFIGNDNSCKIPYIHIGQKEYGDYAKMLSIYNSYAVTNVTKTDQITSSIDK